MLQQSFHPALADETPTNIADYCSIETEFKPVRLDSPDIFAALDRLEETILNSPRVPLTGKTMINEQEILEHLDSIRSNLPEIVATAKEILQYKDRIVAEAQQQVQQILADANQRAYQVANELGIIDRSEQEARQIRQIAISECEQLRQQTITEVERVRNHNIQEMERMRQQTIVECQQIQDGADEYADRVLHDMEHQLNDVLQSIQRGRQRLNSESDSLPQSHSSERDLASSDKRLSA
jgi:cell division septum initiation protein DivIVA